MGAAQFGVPAWMALAVVAAEWGAAMPLLLAVEAPREGGSRWPVTPAADAGPDIGGRR